MKSRIKDLGTHKKNNCLTFYQFQFIVFMFQVRDFCNLSSDFMTTFLVECQHNLMAKLIDFSIHDWSSS